MEKLTTAEILNLLKEDPMLALDQLEKHIDDRVSQRTKDTYQTIRNEVLSSKERWRIFCDGFNLALIILGIALPLTLLGYYLFYRINTGLKMEANELAACSAGNYAQCRAGIDRDRSREELYTSVYKNATGKDLTQPGIIDYTITKESSGNYIIRIKDVSINVTGIK